MIGLEELPSQLRSMRTHAGLTLHDAAEKAGISLSYLSDLERGRTVPSLSTLQDIARAYDTTVYVLFGDAGVEALFNRIKELEEKLHAIHVMTRQDESGPR
jgi:transcriptional regulator with XRE-family HTH domain